jgi:hypothetical protein
MLRLCPAQIRAVVAGGFPGVRFKATLVGRRNDFGEEAETLPDHAANRRARADRGAFRRLRPGRPSPGDYEKKVFGFLSDAAKPAPLTDFQKPYNGNSPAFCNPPDGDPEPCQTGGVRDIKKNYFISAPAVEKWLAENPPAGVDTKRNTVFFINWWGDGQKPREGFKHHVYTKSNEPDPDTGFNFGRQAQSRKLIAWGGTTAEDEENGLGATRRVWFHDLSAGPDSFTDNWNVDDPDLTGDGVEDYRLPPV